MDTSGDTREQSKQSESLTRIDFSEMKNYELVQELYTLDRQVMSLESLGAPDEVQLGGEHDLEMMLERVREAYDDDADYQVVVNNMLSIQKLSEDMNAS